MLVGPILNVTWGNFEYYWRGSQFIEHYTGLLVSHGISKYINICIVE